MRASLSCANFQQHPASESGSELLRKSHSFEQLVSLADFSNLPSNGWNEMWGVLDSEERASPGQ